MQDCWSFICCFLSSTFGSSLKCDNLNLSYGYYFGRYSSEPPEQVQLRYTCGCSSRYSSRLRDYSVIIPKCHKYACVNSFFLCTVRLWNFFLIYDLSGFKSWVFTTTVLTSFNSLKSFFQGALFSSSSSSSFVISWLFSFAWSTSMELYFYKDVLL